MNYKAILSGLVASTAVGGLLLAPATAMADGDKGKKRGHSKGHHNSAPPKKNGRHDNRDWNKDRRDDDWNRTSNRRDQEDWRRRNDDDWRRREDERRRQEEWRRQEDWRRREDERRRQEEWNRRNDGRYYGGGSYESDRRQQTKNEWRNLAIAAGAVSLLGILQKDSTLTFAGAAGALYSAYRYEQDRKSQNRIDRARAYYFSQPYFYRDGRRYDRRTVTRNGQRYYQFCRS